MRHILGVLLIAFSAGCHAASFDCTKAATSVETMICADAALSQIDDRLSAAYTKALSGAADQAVIRSEQRAWLLNVRNKCSTPACVAQAYSTRLAEIERPVDVAALGLTGVTGTYKQDGAELRVQETADGRIKFYLSASFKMNTGEVAGSALLKGSTAAYVNREDDCSLVMKFAAPGVAITQSGGCGMGLNVNASGAYKQVNSRPPRFP